MKNIKLALSISVLRRPIRAILPQGIGLPLLPRYYNDLKLLKSIFILSYAITSKQYYLSVIEFIFFINPLKDWYINIVFELLSIVSLGV